MWAVVGLVGAVAIGVLTVLLSARHEPRLAEHPWLLPDTAKQHVTIMGGLAGFAVTGIVLIVSLVRSQPGIAATSLNTVVTMFVVAYFYYVGNAFLISYMPSSETSGDHLPRVHFSLASTIEYRTLFVSWFALMPLLQTYELDVPAFVVSVLLPVSLLVGSVIIAVAADGLGLVRVKETYWSMVVATGLALVYAAIVQIVAPEARSEYSSLAVTLVVFCVNGVAFVLAALTSLAPRYPGLARFYERHGRRITIVDMQLTMSVLAFLWLAVVGAI